MRLKSLKRILSLTLPAVPARKGNPTQDLLFFERGTVTAYNGWAAVSGKLDTSFEGLIQASALANHIDSLSDYEVELVAAGDKLAANSRSSKKEFEQQESTGFKDLNLWSEEVGWQECPGEITEGVGLVKEIFTSRNANPARFKSLSGKYLTTHGVTAVGEYVFAGDESPHYKACRYKLPYPVPFEMTLPIQCATVLSHFSGERLRGVAKHRLRDSTEGVLFDFDEVRVFCLLVEDTWQMAEDMGRFENFRNVILINDAVKHELKAILTKERAKIATQNGMDDFLSVNIEGGLISFNHNQDGFRFEISPKDFAGMLKDCSFMGYKNDDEEGLLYFKDKSCEYAYSVDLAGD